MKFNSDLRAGVTAPLVIVSKLLQVSIENDANIYDIEEARGCNLRRHASALHRLGRYCINTFIFIRAGQCDIYTMKWINKYV